MSSPHPRERSAIAQIAAHSRWAQTPDRTAATAPARRAALERFERQVDPDGTLPPDVPRQLRTPQYFDWINLLKQCTAFEAYCKVYKADVEPKKIAEFLIFDPQFPHSIRFSVDRVQEELGLLGAGGVAGKRAQAERLAGRLKASLDYGQVDELLAGDIDGFLRSIQTGCKSIHQSVYDAFIGYSVDELLPG